MTIDQLLCHLKCGLLATLDDIRDFSEDPDAAIHPEYLKTIAMARSLKNSVGPAGLIRLEQDTGRTLSVSVLLPNRLKGFSSSISRPGEVDIVLSVDENGWKHPIVLIENKRYAAGFSTIEDDAVRCAEFICAQGETGSIEVAAVTYFRQEALGVIVAHQVKVGIRALDRIENRVAKLASEFGVFHRHEHVKL